jgi:predicted  nucleic acid-binding Zn-ribbon protein
LRLIENLRKDHDKSLKTAEDLRTNNTDLAKSLSSKEQKIQDLERALTDQRETSERSVSEIISMLKNLFEEYKKISERVWCPSCAAPCRLRTS